jgi:hypothetical protein
MKIPISLPRFHVQRCDETFNITRSHSPEVFTRIDQQHPFRERRAAHPNRAYIGTLDLE